MPTRLPRRSDLVVAFRRDATSPSGNGAHGWRIEVALPDAPWADLAIDVDALQFVVQRREKRGGAREAGTRLLARLRDVLSGAPATFEGASSYLAADDHRAWRCLVVSERSLDGEGSMPWIGAADLPWEWIGWRRLGAPAYRPVASGRMHVVRWVPGIEPFHSGPQHVLEHRPPLRPARVRVLVVVGAIDQPPVAVARREQLIDAAKCVRDQLPADRFDVTLVLGAGRALDSQGFELRSDRFDEHVTADQVVELIRGGGFDVVHFLGHAGTPDVAGAAGADAEPGAPLVLAAIPTALELRRGRSPQWITFDALRDALNDRQPSLLLLQSCSTPHAAARALLRAVDHVVCCTGPVDPATFEPMARAFYGRLGAGGEVDRAVVDARVACGGAGDLAHWARSLEMTLFAPPHELARRRWLESVAAQHRNLLGGVFRRWFPRGDQDVLGELYVALDVGVEPGRHGEGDRQVELEELISRAPREAGVPVRWVLLGAPGGGKTTVLRWFARTLAEAWHVPEGGKPQRLPIYRRLQSLAPPGEATAAAQHAAAATASATAWVEAARGSPEEAQRRHRLEDPRWPSALRLASFDAALADAFCRHDERGACVLLLDGLDEADDRNALRSQLEELHSRWRSPIVVAGRELREKDDPVPVGFGTARLLPLELEEGPSARAGAGRPTCRRFAERWFRARAKADGREASVAEPDVQRRAAELVAALVQLEPELTRVPLFLHLAAVVHERKGDVPRSRRELFDAFIDVLLESQHHESGRFAWHDDARDLLGEFAAELAAAGSEGLQRDELCDRMQAWADADAGAPGGRTRRRLYRKLLASPAAGRWAGQPSALVAEVARATGLLAQRAGGESSSFAPAPVPRRSSESGAPWCFAVKPFQDYFVARWLARAFFANATGAGPAPDASSQVDAAIAWVERCTGTQGLAKSVAYWGESLALLTTWLARPQRDDWLRRLLQASDALALRALAYDADPSPEVFGEVLALPQAWRERVAALLDLEQRVGERSKVTALLHAIAQRASRIEDLVLVDAAFAVRQESARQEAEHADIERDRSKVLMHVVARAKEQAQAGQPAGELDARALRAGFAEVPGLEALGAPLPQRRLWRRIPNGRFLMGSPKTERERLDREVQHLVDLSEDYWIAAVPVTLRQYRCFDPQHTQSFDSDPDLPAIEVSWYEARTFCRWLTAQIGALGIDEIRRTLQIELAEAELEQLRSGAKRLVVSLPTEAQWERAARGDGAQSSDRFWSGGDLSPAVAVFGREWDEGPQPVARWGDGILRELRSARRRGAGELGPARRCNAFGLYDVHGNVWEWCADGFGYYEVGDDGTPVVDPRGAPSGFFRVVRGGSFGSEAWVCRSAYRGRFDPWFRNGGQGFRVALSLVAVPQLGGSSLDL